jgi:hypothetical protein
MEKGRAIAVVGGLVLALAVLGQVVRDSDPLRPSQTQAYGAPAPWGQLATGVCQAMQDRISYSGYQHWKPLADNRPLSRVAVLRRELLELHEDGLRQIRAHGPPTAGAPARAVVLYEGMLAAIRNVIGAAERGDAAAYDEANFRMMLAIQATRTAFDRAGAGRICSFAI